MIIFSFPFYPFRCKFPDLFFSGLIKLDSFIYCDVFIWPFVCVLADHSKKLEIKKYYSVTAVNFEKKPVEIKIPCVKAT